MMPYVEEICQAGRVRETRKYYTASYHRPGIQRQKNFRPTPKEQARVNDRHAEMKLRRQLNENFRPGDYHLTLTYRKEDRPPPEAVPAILERFLRGMRKSYRAAGKELKYISVTECGKRGAIHHHIVVNSHDLQEIRRLWTYGSVYVSVLDSSGQYAQLASYLIKQTKQTFRADGAPYRRRWNSSQNLRQPKITKHVIGRNSWRKEPKPLKGYYIEQDKTDNGEYCGFEYQFYSQVKITKQKRRC